MLVLDDIIDWALEQDEWKQDLIRRLIENGDYNSKDVDDISNLILKEFGYIENLEVKPKVLDREKNKSIKKFEDKKVVIQKINNLKNVNALCPKSSLVFAEDGLTIIYGQNGVGKSGYTRVLKKTCKAREVDPVLPNIFVDSDKKQISADIYFSVDQDNRMHPWTNDQDRVEYLDQLVVHDSKCAKIQVNESNELFYLPGGADIFSRIIDFIDDVKKQIYKYKPDNVTLDLSKFDKSTNTYKILNEISVKSDYEKIKNELLWDESLEKRLNEVIKKITEANEEGVRKKVKEINSRIQKLERIKDKYIEVNSVLNIEKFKSLKEKNLRRLETKAAMQSISNDISEKSKISSTGGDLWRLMYVAAKDFSEQEAYKEVSYPNLDGVCVLCQQELDDKAKSRMNSFKSYIEGEVNKRYDEYDRWYNMSLEVLESIRPKIKTLEENILDIETSMSDEENKTYIKCIDDIKRNLSMFDKELAGGDLEPDSIVDSKLNTLIQEKVNEFSKQIEEVKKTIDPEVLKKLKEQKNELESVKLAFGISTQVESYINFLKKDAHFKKMEKKLETRSISMKGKSIITDALRKNFLVDLKEELNRLGGGRIPLHLTSSTKSGEPNFKISLEGADLPKKCDLDAILSEGEQKIASIAGFMAELNLAKHANGVIFDDPVTSLDHKFREKIARRLVEEALKRQVIIFTHDISFLFELNRIATELKVPTLPQNIKRDGSISGVISTNHPWHAQSTTKRVKTMRQMVVELKKLDLEGVGYNEKAAIIYGRVRETWERFVEEILLNEVVLRFGQSVQTQRLSGVLVEDSDFEFIYHEMAKASKYMDGHDKCLPITDSRPEIKELSEDVEKLATYLDQVQKRANKKSKERKSSVHSPPKAKILS